MIVSMQERDQRLGSGLLTCPESLVGPHLEQGPVEPFYFSVGLGMVGTSPGVDDAAWRVDRDARRHEGALRGVRPVRPDHVSLNDD